jgi:hypothetical protein
MLFDKILFRIGCLLLPLILQAQLRPALASEDTFLVTPYYSDADGDGYGNPAIVVLSSTGPPPGFVADNTDCNPTTPTQYRLGNFYIDFDNDTFYDGTPIPSAVCYGLATPSGYVPTIIGSDCDDTKFEVNPNHVEVLANTVDDNCDGHIDEIGPYVTLMPAFCGNILPRVGSIIYATTLPGVTGWRFEVTLGDSVTVFDSDVNHFSLTDLPVTPTYLSTYSIRISVRTNGFWRAYGPSVCTVSTPRAPIVTQLLPQQCGMLMTNMGNIMYCYQNLTATLYRFELSDGVHPARNYDSVNNRFVMQNFVGSAEFATTYTVRIAMFIAGVWEDFGPSCSVTTPPLPELSRVIDSQCGMTFSNTWTTIYTGQVPEAEMYRFEVRNGSSIRFYDTPLSRFNLHNLAGAPPAASTVYTIRVAIMYHGAYLAFGPPCTVTTTSVITRQATPHDIVFKAKAAPNPFSESFAVELEADPEMPTDIKVYDMFGKIVETRTPTISQADRLEMGSGYASGVYTVVVTQGEEQRLLRVVKR